MEQPTATDVREAVEVMTTVLAPAVDLDWEVQAGPLDWSCWTTTAHVAHDLLAYACQLSVRPTDAYLPLDLVVRADAPIPKLLSVVRSTAEILAMTLDTVGPQARAWHWGMTDRTGFAALGLNEILVHTWDITQGLGVSWEPPQHLARLVLDRYFSQAPPGAAAHVLLWSTGRIALPGHPRRPNWAPSPPPTDQPGQDW